MNLRVHTPIRHAGLVTARSRYVCAGIPIMDLRGISDYLMWDTKDDSRWFVLEEDVDEELLRVMIDRFPDGATLRMEGSGMLTDVVAYYDYNIGKSTKVARRRIKALYECLRIYWIVMKHHRTETLEADQAHEEEMLKNNL